MRGEDTKPLPKFAMQSILDITRKLIKTQSYKTQKYFTVNGQIFFFQHHNFFLKYTESFTPEIMLKISKEMRLKIKKMSKSMS